MYCPSKIAQAKLYGYYILRIMKFACGTIVLGFSFIIEIFSDKKSLGWKHSHFNLQLKNWCIGELGHYFIVRKKWRWLKKKKEKKFPRFSTKEKTTTILVATERGSDN